MTSTFLPRGAILIAEGARVPASIQTGAKAYIQGWQLANNLDRRGLTQTIRQAGWKLFSLEATFERWVFGFNDQQAVRKAIKRIAAPIRAQSFNCLEIKRVETRRFLGFPYVLVAAHSWHIQENLALASIQL
jgi:hypothetical protein